MFVNKLLTFAPAFTEKDRGEASIYQQLLMSIIMNDSLNSLVRSVLGNVGLAFFFFASLRLAKKNSSNVSQCRLHASSIT